MFSVLCFVHNAKGPSSILDRIPTSFFSLMLCADPETMKKQSVVAVLYVRTRMLNVVCCLVLPSVSF